MLPEQEDKLDTYAYLFVKYNNRERAYREAFESDAKPTSIASNAYKLHRNQRVLDQIEFWRAELKENRKIDLERLLDELEEARQVARDAMQIAVMVSATMGKAKLAGLDKQVLVHTGPDGGPLMPRKIELVAPGFEQEEIEQGDDVDE